MAAIVSLLPALFSHARYASSRMAWLQSMFSLAFQLAHTPTRNPMLTCLAHMRREATCSHAESRHKYTRCPYLARHAKPPAALQIFAGTRPGSLPCHAKILHCATCAFVPHALTSRPSLWHSQRISSFQSSIRFQASRTVIAMKNCNHF